MALFDPPLPFPPPDPDPDPEPSPFAFPLQICSRRLLLWTLTTLPSLQLSPPAIPPSMVVSVPRSEPPTKFRKEPPPPVLPVQPSLAAVVCTADLSFKEALEEGGSEAPSTEDIEAEEK
ncbi:unnamed protein product [Microthlaspi erraticum]|uniref:Uncharacterized protein n=1 Tax=Microthlaspi erraticum TaxID=1685480 RepID=A0A6D2IT49_9BRAS|nr:unnamed protein product [Microthlaspi erraticum]